MQVVTIAGIFILGIHWQATIPVSASHAQNQIVFWSYRMQSALSASPVQNQTFLVFQSTVHDRPSVSASPVQNQTVFSGLAERGQ